MLAIIPGMLSTNDSGFGPVIPLNDEQRAPAPQKASAKVWW